MRKHTGTSGTDADQSHQLRDRRLSSFLKIRLARHLDLANLFLDQL